MLFWWGGVTNWLNNLAQSNRQMDINHDWSLSLQVSSTTNVHRGFGDPPRWIWMEIFYLKLYVKVVVNRAP